MRLSTVRIPSAYEKSLEQFVSDPKTVVGYVAPTADVAPQAAHVEPMKLLGQKNFLLPGGQVLRAGMPWDPEGTKKVKAAAEVAECGVQILNAQWPGMELVHGFGLTIQTVNATISVADAAHAWNGALTTGEYGKTVLPTIDAAADLLGCLTFIYPPLQHHYGLLATLVLKGVSKAGKAQELYGVNIHRPRLA
jgi:hypothetical protein